MFTAKNRFYCFSPPVMIATFVIETGLLIYTLWRYKLTTVGRLVAALLACLAVFQLAEFNVCQGGAGLGSFWSRLGFICITLLPPLGLHLILSLSKRGLKPLAWLAYASGIYFVVMFGFSSTAFYSHVCAGNYAIFQLAKNYGGFYFAYYYGWLILGILLSLYFSVSATIKVRQALVFQTFGYLSFILPTGIVNALNPKTLEAIPSIMCGFAIVYALTLVFGISPLTLTQRPAKK